MDRAAKDLPVEPKIRSTKQILILLPKVKQLFLFVRLTSDHIFAYLSPETIASALSYSRPPSCNRHEKRFFRLLIS